MGLYFFLPGSKTVFSYNPDSVTRIQGSQISLIHCGDDGFLKCLDAMFPSNQSRSGQDGPRAQVCSVSITIPTWRPSADSALKRSIIEKIKERLPIELAGNLKRALMSDFNLNDPTVLIYAEVEIDGAVQRLWLPASMNWRRVSMPVRLVRLGESLMYQEAEGQLKVLLRHSIPLAP
jgi:hypothetical protein